MKRRFFLSLVISAVPTLAQLPPPNASGVSAGHEHFAVHDVEAATRFWTTLGGVPTQLGQIKLIEFPGVFIMLRQGDPKGGERTTVEHLGFTVKNLSESLAKWEAAGIKPDTIVTPNGSRTKVTGRKSVFLHAPDDVALEITEDSSLRTPIASDTLSIQVPNVAEARAWYAKWFGDEIPGSKLRFTEAKGTIVGTKGHSLDHIGFEVKNLEDLCKKFEAAGIKLDVPYRKPGTIPLSVAFVTDPWGTSIELNEGFSAVP